MKKVILFIAAIAFLSFSCNKYCHCKYYVDGKLEKDFKGEFINVPNKDNEVKDCTDYSEPLKEIDGVTYETKCK